MQIQSEQEGPWYRQFWLWFVLAPPMAAIVLGLSLLGTAINHRDGVVVGDYDRVGRAMHMYMGREELATELGVEARLHLDADGISALLTGLETQPDKLKLLLSHPTHADRDLDLVLDRTATGIYRVDKLDWSPDRWYVRLEPEEREWRLVGELNRGDRELNLIPRPAVN